MAIYQSLPSSNFSTTVGLTFFLVPIYETFDGVLILVGVASGYGYGTSLLLLSPGRTSKVFLGFTTLTLLVLFYNRCTVLPFARAIDKSILYDELTYLH